MEKLEFEWDDGKAQTNAKKHGITFNEAQSVFADLLSSTFPDPDHSLEEDRLITIGTSDRNRLLVVSHTDRAGRTRIISARKATRRERNAYEEEA